jgi:uncharacterized Zn finger protein
MKPGASGDGGPVPQGSDYHLLVPCRRCGHDLSAHLSQYRGRQAPGKPCRKAGCDCPDFTVRCQHCGHLWPAPCPHWPAEG